MIDSGDTVATKLQLGDCIEGMRRLDTASIDAVITDPPYGYGIWAKKWDRFETLDDFEKFTQAWATEAVRVLKPDGFLLVFGAPRTYHRLATGVEKAHAYVRDQFTWLFGNGAGINSKHGLLKPGFEPILVASKTPSARLRIESASIVADDQPVRRPPNVAMDEDVAAELDRRVGPLKSGSRQRGVRKSIGMMGGSGGDDSPAIVGSAGSASRYFYVARIRGQKDRPANVVVKPLSLMKWLVRLVAGPGDVILDPFTGTGATALAAIQCGCDWLGFEKEENVRAMAIELIQRELDRTSQTSLFG